MSTEVDRILLDRLFTALFRLLVLSSGERLKGAKWLADL